VFSLLAVSLTVHKHYNNVDTCI